MVSPAEIARSLRGKKAGKGKWKAKCVAHPDKTASLSVTDMGHGRTRLHCFAGCSQEDVLNAAGLRWRDLRPDGPVNPEIRRRMSLEDRRECLEKELACVSIILILEPDLRRYWEGAEERIQGELAQLRCVLEPEKVIREWQAKQFQRRVRRVGWEQLWKEIYE